MNLSPYPKYKPSGVEWLGDVPEHWHVKRGRFCMDVNPGSIRLRTLGNDDEVSFVPMEAVGEYGGLILEQTRSISEVGSGYTEFDDGDVVVAKITPCFENGKGALVAGLVNGAAFGTTELHVLRAAPTLDRRFLFYFTISRLFRSTGEGEMYGAGGQKRVPPEFCENVRIPLPPPDDQRTIADFLDYETEKIDRLVAKKQTLIERLKEKRAALISRTVTRGLPPAAARSAGLDPHPKLKPTGIEWLSDVPEHWRWTKLKYVAEKIVDCPHETPIYTPGGDYVAIRTADLRLGKVDLSAAYKLEEDEYRKRIRREPLLAGDIVYGREGERWGFAATVPVGVPCCLGQRMMQFRASRNFHAGFLMWHLNATSVYQQGDVDTLGATSPHVNVETIRNYFLARPPFEEQHAIAVFLDRETSKLDHMVTKVEDAIERLQEYRTALITAAVTGKIDVRKQFVNS